MRRPRNLSRMRFIVNPAAGPRRKDMTAVIRQALTGSDVAFDVVRTGYHGHGAVLAREAVEEGIERVVAVGGDGTLNEVGGALVGRDAALGLIPSGTGNAFAGTLGIPRHATRACRLLLQRHTRWFDAGKIGDRVFFSTAGLGVDGAVSGRYAAAGDEARGFLKYARLTLEVFRTYAPEEIRMTLAEGIELRAHPVVLTIANTPQYGFGAIIAPGARPDDGMLDLCLIEQCGALRALWHGRRLFTGTIDRMPGFRRFRTRGVRIRRPAAGRLQVDGEAIEGAAELEISVMPRAIRVIVPPDGGIDTP